MDKLLKFYINLFGKNMWALLHLICAGILTKLVYLFAPVTFQGFLKGLYATLILSVFFIIIEMVWNALKFGQSVISVYGGPGLYLVSMAGNVIAALVGYIIGMPW